ncbi:Aa trans domain containing protein [Trichuris trichiura]|uniref:Aa trans domain containing protein n=1 Tax=Trichuris trichiura TaxID=36087 RepID=A0A077YWS8_TRITR|nr:Aa trans domain containing protein [Trichuris trichiura]
MKKEGSGLPPSRYGLHECSFILYSFNQAASLRAISAVGSLDCHLGLGSGLVVRSNSAYIRAIPRNYGPPLAVSEPLMPLQEKDGEKKRIEHKFEVEIVSASGTLDQTFYRQFHSARAKLPSGVTDEQAMMNLIKAVIGTGILSLSQAFHNSGLWFALILVVFTNWINVLCLRKMIRCAHIICKRYITIAGDIPNVRLLTFSTGRTAVDYGEMGELAVALGPQRFRRHAHLFREAINIFLYLLQFGSCSVYFIFAAENIRQVADPKGYLPIVAYIAFLLPVELLLCSIRQLKWLAVPSTIANLLYLTAFGILFYYIFDNMPDWRRLPAVQNPAMWPLAFGSIMFAFSSAGTILPIENRCKTPGNLLRWNGVVNTSYGIITILSVAVGMFGYIKYGDAIQGSITLNMPKDEVLAMSAKVMVVTTIILSFPIQFYSPMEVITAILKRRFKNEKTMLLVEYAVRYALVFVTFAFAALVPRLGLFISLVGALTASSLAFLFPTLIDVLLHYEPGNSTFLIIKNALIFAFGLIGLMTGTVTTIEAIEKNATLSVDDEYYKQLHAIRAKMPDTVSDEQAMMNLIKAVVGTGILSLPQAFHNSGLWCLIRLYFSRRSLSLFEVADPDRTLPLTAYVAMFLPVELALCSIRQLRWLAIPSTVANGLYIVAFISIFYYVFSDFPSWQRLPSIQDVALWPLAFGTIMFAFNCSGMIVPIENRCRTPGNLLKWNGVINVSYVIITAISSAVGFYGYIKYGSEIRGSITLNLPQSEPLAQAVKIMTAITIILSFPIQFYSATEVLIELMNKRVKSPKKAFLMEYAIRYLVVVVIFAFAVLIPRLGLFISLVGALTGSILGFFFPPIIDVIVQYRGHKRPVWLYINNLLCFAYGMIGLVSGTATSIAAIVKSFS